MEVPAHPLDSGLAETGSVRTLAVNRLPTIPGFGGNPVQCERFQVPTRIPN